MRLLVYSLTVLDIIHTIFITHNVYDIVAVNWGNPSIFLNLPWSTAAIAFPSVIVASEVQLFFAWRIWVFGRTSLFRTMSVLVILLCVLQFVFGFAQATVFAAGGGLQPEKLASPWTRKLSILWLSSACVCDVMIAATTAFILFNAKSGANVVKSTGAILDHLIIRSIQSGTIVALGSIAQLILSHVWPNTSMQTPPFFLNGKIYANIVLATLNDRSRFTQAGASVVTSNVSSSAGTFRAAQAQIRSDINHIELPAFGDSQVNADGKVSNLAYNHSI